MNDCKPVKVMAQCTSHCQNCQGRSKRGSSSHLVNHSRHFADRAGGYRRQISSGGLRWMPMGERTLVPDAGEVVLDQMMAEGRSELVMVLRPAGGGSVCPGCRQASRRIHSQYRRRLNDLPWEGIPVRIELRVRRFFCETEDCGHHIFTERLPKTVQRYARRTCRLSEALERIALVLGGCLAPAWLTNWAFWPAIRRCCVSCGTRPWRPPRRHHACWASTTGRGARVVDTARFSVTWSVARSSIYCRTGARRALRNGCVLIPERRSSAGTEPVCTPKRRRKPRRKRHRWRIDGTFFTT